MDFYQRLGTLTFVLLLLILFFGVAIADSDPTFEIEESVEQELSFEHAMTLDGYYEDGKVTYAASKWAVIDVDGEDREQQVLDEEEWKIYTKDDQWVNWVEGETVEDATSRELEPDSMSVSRSETINYEFEEEGRYAFTLTLAKTDGTHDFESETWDYETEEIVTEKYVFAVDDEEGIIEVITP